MYKFLANRIPLVPRLSERDFYSVLSACQPERLLKIAASIDGSVTCVQLHRTTPSKVGITTEKYATRSYCWGGLQDFQLNTSSEDTLTYGISLSTLPKTLYDAV